MFNKFPHQCTKMGEAAPLEYLGSSPFLKRQELCCFWNVATSAYLLILKLAYVVCGLRTEYLKRGKQRIRLEVKEPGFVQLDVLYMSYCTLNTFADLMRAIMETTNPKLNPAGAARPSHYQR